MASSSNTRKNSTMEDKFNEIARRVEDEKVSYIGLVPVLMDITFSLSASLISAPFRGRNGAPTYRRAVSYALIREVLNSFTVAEGQKMTSSTEKAYRRVAKSRNWTAHTIGLEHDAKGHWLGHSDAKYVMIYFHGGGYVVSATPAHIKYQFELQRAIRRLGHDFSIFSVSYTLAPKSVYPTQLAQAAAALRFLVQDEGRDPETVLLGGDSAGGNLAAALLSHLAHPHWGVETVDLGKRMLRGALMISPWVAFGTDDDSFRRNAKSDYLAIAGLNRACNTYIGPGGRHDNYTEPVRAPPEWWADVANIVGEIMIWGGGGEVLIDGIRRFKRKVKAGFNLAAYIDGSGVATSELGDGNFYIGPAETPMTPIQQENKTVDSNKTASPKAPMETPPSVASRREDEFKSDEGRGRERNMVSSLEGAERVIFVESPRMAHEEMILDYLLRIGGKREGAMAIEGWIHCLLKEKGMDEISLSPEQDFSSLEEQQFSSLPKQRRSSSAVPEEYPSPLLERKSSSLPEDFPSPLLERKSSSLLEDHSSPLLERKSSSLPEEHSSPSLERKSSPSLERKSSPSLERKSSPSLERKSSPPLERKSSPSLERKSSTLLEQKSSALPEEHSSGSPEQMSSSLLEERSSPLQEQKFGLLPEEHLSSLPEQESSSLPEERLNSLPEQDSSSLSEEHFDALPDGYFHSLPEQHFEPFDPRLSLLANRQRNKQPLN